ncbi:GTP cyclohydrolase II domain containing protein [Amanita muscaria]
MAIVANTAHLREHELSADAALLDFLTSPTPPIKGKFARRDAALDPLLLAVAAATGPHVTRNHYHHNFVPAVLQSSDKRLTDDSEHKHLAYVSRQAPRRQRLQNILNEERKENDATSVNAIDYPYKRRLSQSNNSGAKFRPNDIITFTKAPTPQLEIRCMARTRIPTPHGTVFLHLYHNNHDTKEHLAIVVDPGQLSPTPDLPPIPPIRSRSLDSAWSENETDMDRIVRGAYIGRLSSKSIQAAAPPSGSVAFNGTVPPPLIRIHSECFTGETIGSMRCDCGEQLDEAIRRISQPIHFGNATIPGRGAVIYLRQEGRGIGLLSKIRAYNLQDLGHDTVTANLMLGYKADERGYEIAAAILGDLGLGSSGKGNGVRVLTNNPDKVNALRKEGIDIVERVPMIPRSWQQRQTQHEESGEERTVGATVVGGNAVHGEDLDKYLKTKVLRMGHMLPLWLGDMHRVE